MVTVAAWYQKLDKYQQLADNCWNPGTQSNTSWRDLQTNDEQIGDEEQNGVAGGCALACPLVPFFLPPHLLQNARPRKVVPKPPLHSLLSLAGIKIRITSSSTLLQLYLLRKPPQSKMLLVVSAGGRLMAKMKGMQRAREQVHLFTHEECHDLRSVPNWLQ